MSLNLFGAQQLLQSLTTTRQRIARRETLLKSRMIEAETELNDILMIKSLSEIQIENTQALIKQLEDSDANTGSTPIVADH